MNQIDRAVGLGTLFSTLTAAAAPAHTVVTAKPLYEGVPQLEIRPALRHWFETAFATLHLWAERARARRDLGRLGDHLLRDVGIDRADAEVEAQKPFWQA